MIKTSKNTLTPKNDFFVASFNLNFFGMGNVQTVVFGRVPEPMHVHHRIICRTQSKVESNDLEKSAVAYNVGFIGSPYKPHILCDSADVWSS